MKTTDLFSNYQNIVIQLAETYRRAKLNSNLDAKYLTMLHIINLAQMADTNDKQKRLARALDCFLKINDK